VDEMIGRVDVLDTSRASEHWKRRGLDFSKVLAAPEVPPNGAVRCSGPRVRDTSEALDAGLVEKARRAISSGKPVSLFAAIRNSNRAVGAMLSAEVSGQYGGAGLPPDTIKCKFKGSAGQSFGAFLAPGITFELEGDANDYLGKGLSGGKIIVYPPKDSTYRPQNNSIAGNVNLFGATGGEVFVNGMAGERFAVRNSGAVAVVEGVGDHGCEYMTGGRVIVLGETGINFAAGMSGGIAYVLDENQLFDTKCNLEMVDIEPVIDDADKGFLNTYIQRHVRYTGSQYAARIIRDWIEMLPLFVKVMPVEYRRALERMRRDESTETETVAVTEEVYG
ncbi:MAG: glutamate synthase subunit alpha, partial [Chitinivibrionales bacterium]|nr:glutamate synthase subunit alpha [Chitinivibrionales bacterium]MBD3394109.1 glutamate synthase subunit alpha [Chitinivibrionales bacterium]